MTMITVTHEREYDTLQKAESSKTYLRLYTAAFESGLVATLKPVNFTVFLTICSYMNAEGECNPTQDAILERCGLTKPTVIKAIDELTRTDINGVPLIRREIKYIKGKKASVYTINPVSQVAIFDGSVADVTKSKPEIIVRDKPKRKATTRTKPEVTISDLMEKEELNAPDVVKLFCLIYKDVYGEDLKVSFPRFSKLANDTLIGKYDAEQLKKMVDSYVRHYETQWATTDYPRPLLGGMCSFGGEKALQFAGDSIKTVKEYEALEAQAEADALKASELLASQLAKFKEAKKERE
ncbi:helix-turn-helix domain-containing protein [Bacillus wiedmannii]|uniref:helix-turn-helix domain-containing protein n=1 Tax=Bacillus wiedmannii TaxID=1890302 RepID=UPI000BEFB1B3|nr:helix-turn-helix domain-containing protein [Bacillus wiedmannii]PEM08514.1 hypothetical protein CN610_19875 [Bacillus wiedmannii]